MAMRLPDGRYGNRAGFGGTCGKCGGKFAAGEYIVRLPGNTHAAPRESSAADWTYNAATRTATAEMSTLFWSEFPPAIALKAVNKPVTNILRQTRIERDADGDIVKVEYHCDATNLHAVIFND
jgi:hypothetical protein